MKTIDVTDKTDLKATLALRGGEYRCYAHEGPLVGWENAYVYLVALISTPPLPAFFDPDAHPFGLACCQWGPTLVRPEPHWHWCDVEPSTKQYICEELAELCDDDWYVPNEWAYLAISLEPFAAQPE